MIIGGPPSGWMRALRTRSLKSSSSARTSRSVVMPVEAVVELGVVGAQLQRRREHAGDLLALDELLDPPVRVVVWPMFGERLAEARQVVEVSARDGLLDLQVDVLALLLRIRLAAAALPVRSSRSWRGVALRHGSTVRRRDTGRQKAVARRPRLGHRERPVGERVRGRGEQGQRREEGGS